jgi:polysaccharide export outer membrane protein
MIRVDKINMSFQALGRWLVFSVFTFLLNGCADDVLEASKALALSRGEATAIKATKDYVLRQGDLLTVKFYFTPELNEQTPIRPDGKITMQLVGDIEAADLTVPEFRTKLTEAYQQYLKHPEISVTVNTFDKQRIFIGGEVAHAGALPLHQGMTVLQAIFMAGGYRDTAEPTEVLVIREKEPNKPELLMVDLQSGLDSVTQVDDVYLLPHDVVMVPKSTIAKMDQFVDQWINQLIPVARSFALNYNMGTLLTQ